MIVPCLIINHFPRLLITNLFLETSNYQKLSDQIGKKIVAGAHYPERTSTLSNLCPDRAIFSWCVSRELLSQLWSVYDRTQRWRKWRPKRSPASFVCLAQPYFPFQRWFRPYTERRGDRRSRETILKIAQSGYRLSLRLIMRDGSSGLWAPDTTYVSTTFAKANTVNLEEKISTIQFHNHAQ